MQDLLSDEKQDLGFAPAPELTGRARMLKALNCKPVDRPPLWLMRQAGRCLPEYRALRKDHSFIDLIQSPQLAAEVTLQPIRRFGFDAAILFSDILVVPEAMGQGFSFRESGGVAMDFRLRDLNGIRQLNVSGVADRLQYVANALGLIKSELGKRTALLGFAGSPWTLANFMLEGGSVKDHAQALNLFNTDWVAFDLLAQKLTRAVTDFLNLQIAAGVDAVQIFDSHGGLLPPANFEAASGQWMRKIISGLSMPVPVIVFSKGARDWNSLANTGANVIGIDYEIDLAEAVVRLPADVGIQGNFNPQLLTTADAATVSIEASRLLNLMRRRNGYIFNLGHGVPPDARLENLEALVSTVQNFT